MTKLVTQYELNPVHKFTPSCVMNARSYAHVMRKFAGSGNAPLSCDELIQGMAHKGPASGLHRPLAERNRRFVEYLAYNSVLREVA